MKKEYIVLAIAVVAISAVFAQELGSQAFPKPKIDRLAVVGKGLAVLSGDPNSFKLVKVGVAGVNVVLEGEQASLLVGVMDLDGERLRIRNITLTNSSVSGNLYRNDTLVGSFNIASVDKGDETVWYGSMTLDGQSYNLYILSVHRAPKPLELRDKVADYCREHPRDANCREKIHEFCENNPTDARCEALFRAFCLNNTNDERCRYEFKKFCKENPDSDECARFEFKTAKKFCETHGDDERCVKIKERVRIRGLKIETETEVEEEHENETEED